MLDEIIVSGTVGGGVGSQFLNHVELMEAWKYYLGIFLFYFLLLAMLIDNYLDSFLFLNGDIALENRENRVTL